MHRPASLLSIALCAATAVFAVSAQTAAAADAAAGKSLTEQYQCAQCHMPEDWQGNSAAQMQTKIAGVVAGKLKHPKKLELTQSQIADIAAYWSGASH